MSTIKNDDFPVRYLSLPEATLDVWFDTPGSSTPMVTCWLIGFSTMDYYGLS